MIFPLARHSALPSAKSLCVDPSLLSVMLISRNLWQVYQSSGSDPFAGSYSTAAAFLNQVSSYDWSTVCLAHVFTSQSE